MTNSQLKRSAQALVTRLTAMGFTHAGKPLVIDQAYELVASVEGYRNQHILRTKLTPESQNMQGWIDVVNAQKWNGEIEIIHLEGFIASIGMAEQLAAYAKQVASEEAEVCIDDTGPLGSMVAWRAEAKVAQLKLLKVAGYKLAISEFHRPYWVRNDDASIDFDNDKDAWEDAWLDAIGVTIAHHKLTRGTWNSLTDDAQFKLIESCFGHTAESMQEAISALQARWGAEHGYYDRDDWRFDVRNGDTKLGYWEWVQHAIESNGDEEEHCSDCGKPLDGDSYDGLCGNCTDDESDDTNEGKSSTECAKTAEVEGCASKSDSAALPEACELATSAEADAEFDMDDVRFWVSMHYRVIFDSEPHCRQDAWIERYKAANN